MLLPSLTLRWAVQKQRQAQSLADKVFHARLASGAMLYTLQDWQDLAGQATKQQQGQHQHQGPQQAQPAPPAGVPPLHVLQDLLRLLLELSIHLVQAKDDGSLSSTGSPQHGIHSSTWSSQAGAAALMAACVTSLLPALKQAFQDTLLQPTASGSGKTAAGSCDAATTADAAGKLQDSQTAGWVPLLRRLLAFLELSMRYQAQHGPAGNNSSTGGSGGIPEMLLFDL